MARARKSSSSRKPGKRKRDGRNASKQKLKLTIESVSELPAADDSAVPLADRYYDLAETMNARGAIEMAVPFYRQALALLLEERKQLRQLLPEAEQTRSAQNAQIPEAELNGLLPDDSSLRGSDLDLEARVDELAEELNVSSAQQVLAGVAELLSLNGSRELPASGHSLGGKAHLLLGEQEDAWRAFAAARAADPKSPQHALNLAASLLTQKKHQEARSVETSPSAWLGRFTSRTAGTLAAQSGHGRDAGWTIACGTAAASPVASVESRCRDPETLVAVGTCWA